MKREAVLLGVGLLVGCGIGLSLGMRPAPAPATPPAGTAAEGSVADETGTGAAGAATPTAAPDTFDPFAARRQLTALLASANPLRDWAKIDQVLLEWSCNDPWAALDFVRQAPRFPMRNNALAGPLARIAHSTPAAVADWLRQTMAETDRRRIADQIVSMIAEDYPREALALAAEADLNVSTGLIGYTVGELARTAPDEALAMFATLTETERNQAAMMVAQNWTANDPEAALRWCESLRGQSCAAAASTGVLLKLNEEDPATAAAALLHLKPPPDAVCDALRAIAEADPALAFSTAASLPAEQKPRAAKTLAEAAFGADPDRVTALVRSQFPDTEAQPLISQGWTAWRDSDRPAAEAWADNVADPALRRLLAGIRLTDMVESDPTLFLASIDAVPGAQPEADSIRTALANLPAGDAARWVAAHPTVADPTTAVRAFETYFQSDSAAATAWAHSLPPGALRDHVLVSVSENWGRTSERANVEAALAAISDPQLRTSSRFRAFSSLFSTDPAAARNWLAAQPLSAEVRASWEAIAATQGDSPLGEISCD